MLNRQIEMACRGEKEVTCRVRCYHVYKGIWAAAIGEELVCGREPTNMADRYAVAVLKQETIIGNLPRKISKCVFPVLAKRRLYTLYSDG